MGRFLPFLLLLVLQVYTLVDLLRADPVGTRTLPKSVWFLVWLVPVIGPVAWLALGRPRVGPAPGGPPGPGGGGGGITGGPRPSRGPIAPDDDPEFLRRLDDRSWAARMERLRRERGGDGTTPPPPTPPDPASPTAPNEP